MVFKNFKNQRNMVLFNGSIVNAVNSLPKASAMMGYWYFKNAKSPNLDMNHLVLDLETNR